MNIKKIADLLPLGEAYLTGQRHLCRASLVKDILLIGEITSESMYLMLEKVYQYAKGNKSAELGRLLRYRSKIIQAKLN